MGRFSPLLLFTPIRHALKPLRTFCYPARSPYKALALFPLGLPPRPPSRQFDYSPLASVGRKYRGDFILKQDNISYGYESVRRGFSAVARSGGRNESSLEKRGRPMDSVIGGAWRLRLCRVLRLGPLGEAGSG